MSTIPDTPIPAPAANRYTADAQERIARLRAMVAEFPDESEPKPLTMSEKRLARATTSAALEKAAVTAEAALGGVGGDAVDVPEMRDAVAFELAYSSFRDELRSSLRRIDLAILRKKLKAVKSARAVYRMAKGYVTLDAGDALRTHVQDLKQTLVRPPRRKKAAAPAVPEAAVTK